MMKILQYSILVAVLLSLAVLPSAADDAIKEKIVNKTADSITVVDEVGRTVTIDLPVDKLYPPITARWRYCSLLEPGI